VYARLRGSLGPPPIGLRYRCSPLSRDAMRWVHIHNMFLSGTIFWRYMDKVYTSVPGSGGSIPLHAIPCVHGLTCGGGLGVALTFHVCKEGGGWGWNVWGDHWDPLGLCECDDLCVGGLQGFRGGNDCVR
jgi:hypothetical protein